jgi:ankyrin repeat protein
MSMSMTVSQEEIDAFVGVCHGNLDAVKAALAEHPELLEARSSLDESPLGAAAHVGNRQIAEYLLSQGAQPDICAAAMLGDLDALRGCLNDDPSAANTSGAHNIPALFHAVAGGSVPAVELLIEHGAPPASVTGPGSAALNMAAARGHIEMAAWLIERGAPSDVADFQGKTALQRAEEAGHVEIARMIRDSSSTAT